MRSHFRPAALLAICFGSIVFISSNSKPTSSIIVKPVNQVNTAPKIQVAILLDVSGSMDGLIEQAKAQLWNMVSVMGKATCNNASPQIEIALYEYGRSTNDVKQGYVKQVNGFSTDLDQLSKNLFALNTNGGDEYCGHVMYTSLKNLSWDTSSTSYKVIFIAGNEDFLQGSVSWTKVCEEARKKGVIVNTIYCGDKMQGIKEHWNLAGECGMGSYTNINQGATIEDIPTPYDSALFTLNHQLNNTYIAYGYAGNEALAKQQEVDAMNYSMNKSVAAKRVAVKGNKGLYKNSSWDLVDAYDTDSTFVAKVDMTTLPAALQNKSRAELEKIVKEKNQERAAIQKQIEKVNTQRESFMATERVKNVSVDATLESEVEKIIKMQARRFNMVIQ